MHDRYDQELLLGFVEGELPEEQRGQFEARLAANDRLRNVVEQLVADRETLRATPPVPAPPYVLDGIREQLERHLLLDAWAGHEDVSPRARYRWGRIMSVACLLAVIGVGATVVLMILERSRDLWRSAAPAVESSLASGEAASRSTTGQNEIVEASATAAAPSAEETTSGAAPVPGEPEEPDFLTMPAVARVVDPMPTEPVVRREVTVVTADLGATIERLHRWVRQHDHPLRAWPDEKMGSWELVLPTPALAALIDTLHDPPFQRAHLHTTLPPRAATERAHVPRATTERCRVSVRLHGRRTNGTASAL